MPYIRQLKCFEGNGTDYRPLSDDELYRRKVKKFISNRSYKMVLVNKIRTGLKLPPSSIGAKQNRMVSFDNRFAFFIFLLARVDVQQTEHLSHSDLSAFDIE